MTARRRYSEKRARALIDQAELVKAPDWSESRAWHVTAGQDVLVVVTPAYSGGGRQGWTYHLAATGALGHPGPYKTREDAAVAGLGSWLRWATTPPRT